EALPVGDRAKDAGAEEAVPLRLEGAVVDGFGFGDFTMRPAADLLRGSQHDTDGVEVGNRAGELKWIRTEQGVPPWRAFAASPRLLPGFFLRTPPSREAVVTALGRVLKNSRQFSVFSCQSGC